MQAGVPRQFSEGYSAVAQSYRSIVNHYLQPIHRHMADFLASGDFVLEIGAGPASVSAQLEALGATAIASDIAVGMLSEAPETRGQNVVADAHVLPFARGSFSGVASAFAFSHFGDPMTVFREIQRVLRPGGSLIVAQWGPGTRIAAMNAIFATFNHLIGRAPDPFVHILDRETWSSTAGGERLIVSTGLQVRSSYATQFAGSFASSDDALNWYKAFPEGLAAIQELEPTAQAAFDELARRAITALGLDYRFEVNFFEASSAKN